MKKEKNAFPLLYPNAAGIDIASTLHYVAVNPALVADKPIRSFGCYTEDLHVLVEWLQACKVDTVAMEATGIYWVSLYQLIEAAGIEVLVVNARHVKNVRGKKTDVQDAEWIRQLHSCGLLSASFQPDGFARQLRCYMRHRKNLVEMSATHIHMMQKAMEQMNLKLQHVIADITGKSGLAIVDALVRGERDTAVLAGLLDGRIRASREEVKKSLEGIYKEEHLFELRQSLQCWRHYQEKIAECDGQIEKLLLAQADLLPVASGAQQIQSAPAAAAVAKPNKKQQNKNNVQLREPEQLAQLSGVDLSAIFGLSNSSVLEIISETGLDMSKWPTAKHFTAWLNLAPNNKVSGGKVLSSRRERKKNRAGQVFKLAAYAVQRSKNWLASFYHRIKAKAGVPKAITATARKIAVVFYTMLKNQVVFNPVDNAVYDQQCHEQQIQRLKKQAARLGLSVAEQGIVT